MADKIKVNTTRLKRDSERIKRCIDNMDKKADSLKAQVIALNKTWEAPSSDLFKANFLRDVSNLEALLKSLQVVYKYEDNAQKQYERNEKKVEGIVSSL